MLAFAPVPSRPSTAIPAWVTGTAYLVGALVSSSGNVYSAGSSGTSGATAPTGTGTSFDGVITWTYLFAVGVLN
jgi:hypothetical protein